MTDNKALAEHIRNYLESGVDLLLTDDDYKTIIKVLEQEPKTGHWVEDEKQEHVEVIYHCSECGHMAWGECECTNYCGGCGADMREVSE